MTGLAIFGYAALVILACAGAVLFTVLITRYHDRWSDDTCVSVGFLALCCLSILWALGRWSATLWP